MPYTTSLAEVEMRMLLPHIRAEDVTMHFLPAPHWGSLRKLRIEHHGGVDVVDLLWWLMPQIDWGEKLEGMVVESYQGGWRSESARTRVVVKEGLVERGRTKDALVRLWEGVKVRWPVIWEGDWEVREWEVEMRGAEMSRFGRIWEGMAEQERREKKAAVGL
ncbi:hypothetical protein BDZ85DRAFT_267531 [Elsinoe ampelina]|uniref:Uncharacterized protein n=1 Tax=Elsinoe ampelina TaxID=302913 RepID=A0A6A6G3X2_9PEZI|nr:hypothetical protein BDZ85DRAFT_267531 [Elsinoe ampelina]